jgi:hypothetical protein
MAVPPPAPSFPAMLEPTPLPVSLPAAALPFQWPSERGASRSDDAHVRTVPDAPPPAPRPALRAMIAAIGLTACLAFAGIVGLARRQPVSSKSPASAARAASVLSEAPAPAIPPPAAPQTEVTTGQADAPGATTPVAAPGSTPAAAIEATARPAKPVDSATVAIPSGPAPAASANVKTATIAPKAASPAMWRAPADRPGPGF